MAESEASEKFDVKPESQVGVVAVRKSAEHQPRLISPQSLYLMSDRLDKGAQEPEVTRRIPDSTQRDHMRIVLHVVHTCKSRTLALQTRWVQSGQSEQVLLGAHPQMQLKGRSQAAP